MIRNPLIHFVIALVILASVTGGYIVWYHQVEAKSAEVATLKSKIESKTQDAQRSELAKQELITLTADEGTIQQYFVSTNDVVPFLEQLATTGKYLGASVQVVSVSANPGSPYGTLQLSLKIDGTFDAVLRTIGSIEYGPYGTTVSSFSFNAADSSNASSTVAQKWSATAIVNVGTEADGTAGSSDGQSSTTPAAPEIMPTSVPVHAAATTSTKSAGPTTVQ